MAAYSNKIALITGGASGMGYAVAQSLAQSTTASWSIHLLDRNATTGTAVVSSLGPSATFHPVDVTSYSSLAAVFKSIFQAHQRIDFVFANAGIAEKASFYARHSEVRDEPPAEPDLLCLDICLNAVVTTSYLALHYFRLGPEEADRCLVMTASCGGLYPSFYSPIYSAAKHGVVGFMRSISKHSFEKYGVRVNAICPGVVKTGLLTSKEWENFPEKYFTDIANIVDVVSMLLEGGEGEGIREERRVGGGGIGGRERKSGKLWGEAVEISGANWYLRTQPRWCDEGMKMVMGATDVEELVH